MKISELESIRGIAALLVVFFHLPKWNPILDIGVINNGYLMVELFFVLSGFVIFTAYSGKINQKIDLIRFQFLRFGRLYPVHIIFLLAFMGIEVLRYLIRQILDLNYLNIDQNFIPFESNSFSAFIKNIFLLQGVLPNQPYTFNVPAWSISVEFYTYLFFACITILFKKYENIIFLLCTIICLCMLITKLDFGIEPLLRCFAGFFTGCLTASLVKNIKLKVPEIFSIIIFIGIVFFLQLKNSTKYDIAIYFLTSLLILSLILSSSGVLKKILNLNFLKWLGKISYAVYMSHALILYIIDVIMRKVIKLPTVDYPNGNNIVLLNEVQTIFFCIIIIVSVLTLSNYIYIYIEKPIREKSRKFAFRKIV